MSLKIYYIPADWSRNNGMKITPDSASCATVLSGKSQFRIVRNTGAWGPAGIRGRPSSVAYGHLCPGTANQEPWRRVP